MDHGIVTNKYNHINPATNHPTGKVSEIEDRTENKKIIILVWPKQTFWTQLQLSKAVLNAPKKLQISHENND